MLLMAGVLVWLVVRDLRRKETRLAHNLHELEQTREKLLHEEKLAAMGRLSTAIAHEIRNPVAMITSSITSARAIVGTGTGRDVRHRLGGGRTLEPPHHRVPGLREYASPQPDFYLHSDTVAYIADAARAHASQKGVKFDVAGPGDSAGHRRRGTITASADESRPECSRCFARSRHHSVASSLSESHGADRGGERRYADS